MRQDGLFELPLVPGPGFSLTPNQDTFFVVDTSIGYRLPKRYGLISVEAKNLFDKNFRVPGCSSLATH